jgi:hypothetical protein
MASLGAFLGLNGLLIVFISSVGGLALYRVLIRDGDPHDWHLLHAGGSARGIFLIALGGTVHLSSLSPTHAWVASGLVVLFVWASTLAMLLRALSGESGFSFSGAMANRAGFVLYVIGAISLAVGLIWLCWGFAGAF